MYKIAQLANGLTLATASMPHMASVSLGIWVGVGGRYEPAALSGASHFIEHMLFKGTRKRSAKQISEDIEGIGGDLNAYTSEEVTCYFVKGCHDRFDTMFEVMRDMFFHSRFELGEFEKERGVILEELAMCVDQPQQYVLELLNEVCWPGHPLGRNITGSEQTLKALTRDQVVAFRREHYVGGNTLITVAGRFDYPRVLAAMARFARSLRPGRRADFVPVPDHQERPRLKLRTRATEQTQLALGIRTCSRHDERRFALRLLNCLLGENMSSRLFQVIREDRGLAYSIGSSLGVFDDTGTLTISAGLETEKLGPTLKLIQKELKGFTETAPALGELRRARDYLIGQMELSLENTANQMNWIGEQWLGYGKLIPLTVVKDHLLQVKPLEIRAAARDFFRPERLNLALVSPLKSAKNCERWLKI
jgi:predicted Zn-dependent peptidase